MVLLLQSEVQAGQVLAARNSVVRMAEEGHHRFSFNSGTQGSMRLAAGDLVEAPGSILEAKDTKKGR